MLLEILWPLECFAAEVTAMGLQRDVDTDVRGDVVSLDGGGSAGAPCAGQAEVVGALAANVNVTKVVLQSRQSTIF